MRPSEPRPSGSVCPPRTILTLPNDRGSDGGSSPPIALRTCNASVMLPLMGKRGLYFLVFLVCACATAFGQGTTSRVLGTVQDASGAVVPDAAVKLVNEGTRQTFEARTSASGAYAFEAVQTGTYQLDVEAKGFRRFSSHNNLVDIGQPTTVNVKLELGHLPAPGADGAGAHSVVGATALSGVGRVGPSVGSGSHPGSADAA